MGFFLVNTLAWELAGPLLEATFLYKQVSCGEWRAPPSSWCPAGAVKIVTQPRSTTHHFVSQLFVADRGNCNWFMYIAFPNRWFFWKREFHYDQEPENLCCRRFARPVLRTAWSKEGWSGRFSGRSFGGGFVFKGSHIVVIFVYFSLSGFALAKRLLRRVLSFSVVAVLKAGAFDLHFPDLGGSQPLQERILPAASGLAAFKGPNFYPLTGGFEIVLTRQHKFTSDGPFCFQAPKYFPLFPSSWFFLDSCVYKNNDRLSSLSFYR